MLATRSLRAFVLSLLALVSAGCTSSTLPLVDLPADATPVAVQAVAPPAASTSSGFDGQSRIVVRSTPEWTATWPRLVGGAAPAPDIPAVDFSSHTVIVAAMGSRPSGGYSIVIDGVYEANGRLYVVVRETSPGRGCITTQAITAPAAAVSVPRVGPTVTFIDRFESTGC